MAVVESLLQGVRAWLKVAVPGLTDARVIPADDKGPRPPLPYLTVQIQSADVPEAIADEPIAGQDGSGNPTLAVRGFRRATAAVIGYGTDTHEWLTRAGVSLRLPSVNAQLTASGFDVLVLGGITDVSTLVDTRIERRYSRDFDLRYMIETDPETQVEWLVGELDFTFERYDGAPDALSLTLTTE